MLRKKWLSFLVAVSMVAAMLPTTAFADTVETTEPVEPQISVTETAQDEKDPVEGGEQPEVVDNENTATGEGDKGAGQSDEDETVTEETEEETKEPETPADETEEKTEDAEKPASEEAGPDEETAVVPPVTTPEVTETPVADNGIATMAETDNVEMNGKQYATVMAAIADVENNGTATIDLLGDSYEKESVKIDGNKTITINMNGHTIHVTRGAGSTGTETSGMQFINGSTVTIQNGTLTSDVELAGWFIKNYCDLTLNNVTIHSEKFAAGGINHCGATLNLKGCTMGPGKDGAYAVQMGNYHTGNTIAIIDGGTYSGIANETGYWNSNGAGVRNAVKTTIRNATVEKVGTVSGDPFYDNSVMTVESGCTVESVEGYAAQINKDGTANYYASVTAAYEAAETGDTITLCQSDSNVELDSKLVLDKEGVTLDLNGNTITAAAGFTSADRQPHLVEVTADNVIIKDGTLLGTQDTKHGLHVYGGNVTLENVEIDATATGGVSGNYHAAVVVNGAGSDRNASLALQGTVTLKAANEAINVDTNGGTVASLTVAENATVDLSGCASGIVVCDPKDNVSFGKNVNLRLPQSDSLLVNDSADGATISGIENIAGIDPAKVGVGAVVTTNGESKVYSDFKGAYQAAGADSTIKLYEDVKLDSKLVIKTEGLTLDLNGNTITAAAGFTSADRQPHLVEVTADNVIIKDGTLLGTQDTKHGLHVYGGNVTLENVEIDATATGGVSGNYHAAVVVNGAGSDRNASLALQGTVTLKAANEAINVDTNGGTVASLTVAENATVDLSGCASGIVVCDPKDNVSFGKNVNLRLPQSDSLLVNDSADGATISGIENIAGIDPAKVGVGAVVTTNGESKVYSDFKGAYQAAGADSTIKLYEDVKLDSKLVINTKGLTLDLNGQTISASDNFKKKGHLVEITADGVSIVNGTIEGNGYVDHALHVWNADNVTLGNDLVLDNSATTVGGAPLVIGASNVTLEGNTTFVTGENSWYGANVDSSMVGDTKEGSSLKVEGKIVFVGENRYNAGIWVEDSKGGDPVNVTVSFEEGSSAQGNGVDGFRVIYIKKGADNKPQGTVEGADNAGLITDKDGNYVVKPAPAPQPQQPAGGSSHKHNYTWQHSDDEHWQYCADCGQAISNGPHTLQWKDGYQECTVCGYRVGSSTAAAPAAQASAPAAAAPAAPAAPAAAAIPQTGDASNPMLWVVLLAVSGSALGALVYTKKKREE